MGKIVVGKVVVGKVVVGKIVVGKTVVGKVVVTKIVVGKIVVGKIVCDDCCGKNCSVRILPWTITFVDNNDCCYQCCDRLMLFRIPPPSFPSFRSVALSIGPSVRLSIHDS